MPSECPPRASPLEDRPPHAPGRGRARVVPGPRTRAEGHEVALVSARRLTSHNRLFERTPLHVPLTPPLARRAARRAASARPDAVVVVRGRWLRAGDVESLGSRDARAGREPPDRQPRVRAVGEPVPAGGPPGLRPRDGVERASSPPACRRRGPGARSSCHSRTTRALLSRAAGRAQYDVAFVGCASPERVEHARALAGLRLALSGPAGNA